MDLKSILDHHIADVVWASAPLGFGVELLWSKHVLMMLIGFGILALLLPFAVHGQGSVAKILRHAVEAVVLYIRDELVRPNLGHAGDKYLPYFLTLFFFILALNLIGMVPYGATATGNFRVTTGLALGTFFLIHIAGAREHGTVHYFQSIVPSGVPLWLWPLMFPIEALGFVIKAFALAIRLFLNMIAGHIVITVLICLIFIFGKMGLPMFGASAVFSIVMVLFISCLELFVAFLQAYIFTFLTAIFVGGAVHGH